MEDFERLAFIIVSMSQNKYIFNRILNLAAQKQEQKLVSYVTEIKRSYSPIKV